MTTPTPHGHLPGDTPDPATGSAAPLPPTQPDPDSPDIVPAGFWRRWAALFLDQLILSAAFYGVIFAVIVIAALIFGSKGTVTSAFSGNEPPVWFFAAYFAILVLYYAGAGLYYALMESSRHQATLGKMALGIKVTGENGQRLSFAHALGRWFAAALSYLTFYIGFLMAAFTERKRALHDMVASTLVVDRWAFTEHPERQQRGPGGCLIAIIVAALAMTLVAILGILAAIAIPAYQDYVQRSKLSLAIAETTPLTLVVDEFVSREGRCPDPGELDHGPLPDGVGRIRIGLFDDGDCGFALELGGTGNTSLDNGQIWRWIDPEGGFWHCAANIPDRWLPQPCRN